MIDLTKTKLNETSDNVIRITAEDARSTHVDDLLRRQATLRGEGGITRDRGRKWFYQNWFVFMIAGTVAALAGYAIFDPYFKDNLYVQGKVVSIDTNPKAAALHFLGMGGERELPAGQYAQAVVGKETVILLSLTRFRDGEGKFSNLDSSSLKTGDTVGAYVEALPSGSGNVLFANMIVANPKEAAEPVSIEVQVKHKFLSSLLMAPVIAAFIGLFIGAADGILCRLPRRMFLAGFVGMVIGLIGGFISFDIFAELIYSPITHFAQKKGGTLGFSLQVGGRGLAWAVAGMTMGLGQGVALRSKRLFFYGLLGGMLGGLLGGLMFDPIDQLILGRDKTGAQASRWIGFGIVGAVVGLMIGVVERLARDAWLRMTEGPLAGKEFLVFKDVMRMGSSPRSEIYLFNDPQVAAQHAVIRVTGDIYEIENSCEQTPVCLNGRPVRRSRLRHGDRISVGRTSFVFQRQKAE